MTKSEFNLYMVYYVRSSGERKCMVAAKDEEDAYKEAIRFAGNHAKFIKAELITTDVEKVK